MSLVLTPQPVITDQARQQLRTDVLLAAESIALNWPIRTFISRNPLVGFEHLRFHDAVVRAQQLLGGEGYLSLAEYRACWARGRILPADIQWAISEMVPATILGASIQVGRKQIRAADVLLLHLIHGIEVIDARTISWNIRNEQALTRFQPNVSPAVRAHLLADTPGTQSEAGVLTALWKTIDEKLTRSSADTQREHTRPHRPDQPPLQTVAELVDHLTGSVLLRTINDEMIKWLAYFTDEGLGDWAMPGRDSGFYAVWRSLARHDASGWFLGIKNFSKKLQALPVREEDALMLLLHRLEVPEHQRIDYCSRHLAHLHGWSGYVRWKGQQADQHYPIDLVQYLAVRLFYEAELASSTCSVSLTRQATLPNLLSALLRESSNLDELNSTPEETVSTAHMNDAWRLFVLVQYLGLRPADIRALSEYDARTLLGWLESLPMDTHRAIWQEAYERGYRRILLSRLRLPCSGTIPVSTQSCPWAQVVFCIDVRSEPFRRHLETLGAYDTIGFAGFFGVPLFYRTLDHDEELALCPVLIKPKVSMRETPRSDQPVVSEAHLTGSYWREIGEHLFHRMKANPFSSYMLIDLTGALFALVLAGKTILLPFYDRMVSLLRQWFIPTVPTIIPTEKQHPASSTLQTEHNGVGLPLGFASDEQAVVAENSLRLMGLTKNFARLVLICGHGSTTENNPYASAYDCGACGGNHGGPNARVLARLVNNSENRATLRERGIVIPDDTLFLAAEHNTTTDRVTFFDIEDLPPSHRDEHKRLVRDLERAGALTAVERCGKIPGAGRFAASELASGHVAVRSLDWAQTRPEWGLSGNAAFLIARRALTRGVNLDGRVFLHSYDAAADETGKVLETIMTAPLVVGQWINLQYYFSAVDGWTYGSGSKVLHNVVGGIGVMLGRHSDLQTGLPMQSVRNGAQLYHEPMRMTAIIEATVGRLSEIIGRHQVLQRFFDYQWVHLLAMHPETGDLQEYRGEGRWASVRASDEETRW